MFTTTGPNGFSIKFDNGCTFSVQWSLSHYASGRDLGASLKESKEGGEKHRSASAVECAAWDANGKWIKLQGDIIAGWVIADDVLKLMNKVARRKPVTNN